MALELTDERAVRWQQRIPQAEVEHRTTDGHVCRHAEAYVQTCAQTCAQTCT